MKGKVALVTGSGRGIGFAIAKSLAKEGAFVYLAARTKAELLKAKQVIQIAGGQAEMACLNLAEDAAVLDLFKWIDTKHGKLDILVNNAAIYEGFPFIEFPIEKYDELMAVNVRAPFLISQQAFRLMKNSGGTILNISSLAGIQGSLKFPNFSAYVMSKQAIVGMTESLAIEGKRYGIAVNCIAPGAVETDMLKKAAPNLKTKATPANIAEISTFLIQQALDKKMTGVIFQVNTNE